MEVEPFAPLISAIVTMSLLTSSSTSPSAIPDESSVPAIEIEKLAWDVPEVAAKIVDFRGLRAVCIGAAVIVGGSLMMTTLVGLTAVTASLVRGDTAEMVVAQLPQSFALALFLVTGGLLASMAGGYTAKAIAREAGIRHAAWAGIMAIPLSIAISVLLGDSGPGWLNAMSIATIVPAALLGGWLATPREHVSFPRI
jgi:hypothetical protein